MIIRNMSATNATETGQCTSVNRVGLWWKNDGGVNVESEQRECLASIGVVYNAGIGWCLLDAECGSKEYADKASLFVNFLRIYLICFLKRKTVKDQSILVQEYRGDDQPLMEVLGFEKFNNNTNNTLYVLQKEWWTVKIAPNNPFYLSTFFLGTVHEHVQEVVVGDPLSYCSFFQSPVLQEYASCVQQIETLLEKHGKQDMDTSAVPDVQAHPDIEKAFAAYDAALSQCRFGSSADLAYVKRAIDNIEDVIRAAFELTLVTKK